VSSDIFTDQKIRGIFHSEPVWKTAFQEQCFKKPDLAPGGYRGIDHNVKEFAVEFIEQVRVRKSLPA
jgi:hypothetical protein